MVQSLDSLSLKGHHAYVEARWRQHHDMELLLFSQDWGSTLNRGNHEYLQNPIYFGKIPVGLC